jgi:hypothetical protein
MENLCGNRRDLILRKKHGIMQKCYGKMATVDLSMLRAATNSMFIIGDKCESKIY